MTILHVSDLHFNRQWFHWLDEFAPAHDLLAITGDLLDLNHPTSHRRQVAWVTEWVENYGRPLALCSGNHDRVWDDEHSVWRAADWVRDLTGPTTWVDGEVGELAGVTFYCCPESGASRGREADIWLVHQPPVGSDVGWCQAGRCGGDPHLLYSVRKYAPQLVLCGHVHQPLSWIGEFESGIYLNPGCDTHAAYPNHILVDLGEGCVRRERSAGSRPNQNVIIGLSGLPEPRRPLEPQAEPVGAAFSLSTSTE